MPYVAFVPRGFPSRQSIHKNPVQPSQITALVKQLIYNDFNILETNGTTFALNFLILPRDKWGDDS
jgi:hypothetical protein